MSSGITKRKIKRIDIRVHGSMHIEMDKVHASSGNTLEPTTKVGKDQATGSTRRREATVRKARKPAKKTRKAEGPRSTTGRKVTVRNAMDAANNPTKTLKVPTAKSSSLKRGRMATKTPKTTSVPRPIQRVLTFTDDEPLIVSQLKLK